MPSSRISHLTLLIPELLWPEPGDRNVLDNLDCPGLTSLLAHGHFNRQPQQSSETALIQRFNHPEGTPYGALRRLGETGNTLVQDTCWVNADPVHLRFHQERLVLADASTLNISQEEAETLAADLSRHFVDIGHFHIGTSERWYLQLTDRTLLGTMEAPPLSTVTGRSIEQLLPDILPDRASRKLVNEIQTFLHAHPVNQQREKQGLLPINSLWLWGTGHLPPRVESDFDGVWSAHPLAIGLARAAGVSAHPLPNDADTFFTHATPDSHHLIVLEDFLSPVHYENGEAYRSAIKMIDERWFAPLQKALTSGQIKHLHLETTTVYGALTWKFSRYGHWRFWQRRLPLAEIIKNLALSMTTDQ